MMKLRLMLVAFSLAVFVTTGCKPESGNNSENDTETTQNGQQNPTGNSTSGGEGNTTQNHNNNSTTGYTGETEKQPEEKNLQIPFSVRGFVENGQGGEVVLDRMKGGNVEALQSTIINSDGEFHFSGLLPQPGLYQLRFHQGVIHLYLWGGDVRVTTDFGRISNYKVSGSPESQQLRELYVLLNEANTEMRSVQERMQSETNNKRVLEIYDSLGYYQTKFEREKSEKLKAFIREADTSIVAILAANYLPQNKNERFLIELSDKFTELYPENQDVELFRQKVESFRRLSEGQKAPNIVLETPEGETVELTDLRGKYVLIDFWASWCGPCRKENPHMREIYNQYRDKGFEIYGVSLDSKREDWLQAIEEDQIDWVHVSDLMGNESSVAQVYNIMAIPTTFLLDKEGRIIDKNLRAADVEKKLAQLIR